MQLIERTPRTYCHRGYEIEAVDTLGDSRWVVRPIDDRYRPSPELEAGEVYYVRSLAEAREVIATDIGMRRDPKVLGLMPVTRTGRLIPLPSRGPDPRSPQPPEEVR